MSSASITRPSTWLREEESASLSLSPLSARLQLGRPWLGLHEIAYDNTPLGALRLLCAQTEPGEKSEQVVDQYIRGDDLVAQYGQTPQRPLSVHVYWQAFCGVNTGKAVGVDMIVSTQTELLDSDPTLRITNEIPSAAVVPCAKIKSGILLRPQVAACSILLAAHPTDYEDMHTEASTDDELHIAFTLFRPGLEKGVIRRARMRAAFMPRANDEQHAAECYASFISSELPLTT